MIRKLWALLPLIAVIVSLLTVPASASCDVCVGWEEQLAEDHPEHCTYYCTGDSEETCDCGDSYVYEYCSKTHNYDTCIMVIQGDNCQDNGTEVWQCKCGDTTVWPGSTPGDHEWNDGEDDGDGQISYECKVCGETKTENYTPGHTHNYIATVTPPTCTAQGYTHYQCACSHSYIGDYTDKIAHDYVTTVVDPTCERPGYTSRVCSMCGDTIISDEKPIGDHKWVNVGLPTGPACSTSGELHVLGRDTDTMYIKAVPENSYDYAVINMIGGMTYPDSFGSAAVTAVRSDIDYIEIPEEVRNLAEYGVGYDDDTFNRIVWNEEGTVLYIQQAVMLTLTGDEDWTVVDGAGGSYFALKVGEYGTYVTGNIVSNYYESAVVTSSTSNKGIYILSSSAYNDCRVTIRPGDVTALSTWKARLAAWHDAGEPLMAVVVLSSAVETDITDLMPDNCLDVSPGGGLKFENDLTEAVPSEVLYYKMPDSCDAGHYYDTNDICTVCGTVKQKREQKQECSVCHTDRYKVLDDLEHDYAVTVVHPKCDAKGYTEHTCTVCGVSYRDDYKNTLEHQYGQGVTDETAGKITYVCQLCGFVKTDVYIPTHHHSYTQTVVEATCTTQGYTHYVCSCGYHYYADWVKAPGHRYVSAVVDPTCYATGYTIHTCIVCDHFYKDNYTAILKHEFMSTVTEPTCTAEGYTTEICSLCGYDQITNRVPPRGHNMINGVCARCQYSSNCIHTFTETVYPPSCEDIGYTLYTCSKCGDTLQDDFKAALGHLLLETGRISAKCDQDGYIERTCSRSDCGHTEYQTFPAVGHKWDAIGAVVDEDNSSVVTYECKTCKIRKTETLPTAASQAQNWLLTSIRGFSGAIIEIYNTVANGVEIGGVTVGEVIAGCLVLVVVLIFFSFSWRRGSR